LIYERARNEHSLEEKILLVDRLGIKTGCWMYEISGMTGTNGRWVTFWYLGYANIVNKV